MLILICSQWSGHCGKREQHASSSDQQAPHERVKARRGRIKALHHTPPLHQQPAQLLASSEVRRCAQLTHTSSQSSRLLAALKEYVKEVCHKLRRAQMCAGRSLLLDNENFRHRGQQRFDNMTGLVLSHCFDQSSDCGAQCAHYLPFLSRLPSAYCTQHCSTCSTTAGIVPFIILSHEPNLASRAPPPYLNAPRQTFPSTFTQWLYSSFGTQFQQVQSTSSYLIP